MLSGVTLSVSWSYSRRMLMALTTLSPHDSSMATLRLAMSSMYGVSSATWLMPSAMSAATVADAMSVVLAPGQAGPNRRATSFVPSTKDMDVHDRPTACTTGSLGSVVHGRRAAAAGPICSLLAWYVSAVMAPPHSGGNRSLERRRTTPGMRSTRRGPSRSNVASVGSCTATTVARGSSITSGGRSSAPAAMGAGQMSRLDWSR
mmetsp:Transcript_6120/g.14431  ORF Transcript_6120/g.14431 Transcript_6120/m.14431 type:complete len:204 (+) Transcript_6120:426-1037(+)